MSIGFRFLFLLALGVASFTPSAFAQTGAGANKAAGGNSNLEGYLTGGLLGISSSSTQYDLSPGFNFKPLRSWNWLQVGGELTYQKVSFRGGSATNFILSAGPTFNLGPTTGEASFISLGFFVKTGSASYEDPTTSDPNGLGFFLFAGKRFPLSTSISLRPSIGVENAGTSAFIMRPLAISVLF